MPDVPVLQPDTAAVSDQTVQSTEDLEVAAEPAAKVPDHAHVVLVPLANPETAPDLLRIARAIVRADGGKVVGLSIAMGDADAEQAVERMEALHDVAQAVDESIEVLRRTASTVARGILDAAREVGADMMVLGLAHATNGQLDLGRVVRSVVAAATTDVLLYRPGHAVTDLDHLRRVVVGVNDSPESRAAARVGLILGHGFDRPVDVVTVHGRGQPRAVAWSMLDKALADIPGAEDGRRRVVRGATVAGGLTATAKDDDLLVVGFHERTAMQEWIEGDVIKSVLDTAVGPTIAVSRLVEPVRAKRRARAIVDWLRPQLTDIEAETIDWRSQSLAKTSLDYMTLIVVSSVLASLGLLLNSAAVIIGAMLVAPLMGPLVAFAIALRVARLAIVRQALLTVLVGTASAFGVSVIIGWLVPLTEPTAEMLSRGSPTLLDAGVALASGVVGAYATARKDIPAALAGVAIAAALVPPICVSGLALGLADVDLAAGAFLLFTVNVFCIAAVGTGVFAWLGLEQRPDATSGSRHIAVVGALVLPMLIGMLLVGTAASLDVNRAAVEDVLEVVLPEADLVDVEVLDGDGRHVLVTIRSEEPPTSEDVAALRDRLREDLKAPDLDVDVAYVQLLTAR